jgi:hypothetical protein
VTANFNEIYDILFNYFENDPIGITYRKRIVFSEISLINGGRVVMGDVGAFAALFGNIF